MSPCSPWKSADLWDWIEKSLQTYAAVCKWALKAYLFGHLQHLHLQLAISSSALEGDSTSSVGQGSSTNFNL